jgi:hypothetical protein
MVATVKERQTTMGGKLGQPLYIIGLVVVVLFVLSFFGLE